MDAAQYANRRPADGQPARADHSQAPARAKAAISTANQTLGKSKVAAAMNAASPMPVSTR